MKKLLTVFALSTIFICSAFTKSATIQLNTSIEGFSVQYFLYYNSNLLEDGSSVNEIEISQPLTQNGTTNPFTIQATSNMNYDLSIDVGVYPLSFKTTQNNESTTYDSNIIPSVSTLYNLETIPAGYFEDQVVYAFVLSWNGDSSLPAGSYVSEVNIEYTIN